MLNIFSEQYLSDARDSELVASAQQGDRSAMEELILRHQAWIFNVAWRMVGSPHDAEDVTQEILIKMITRLSTFQGKSSFRTWLYRIVANHVITMKKRQRERICSSFERHRNINEYLSEADVPDPRDVPGDVNLLVEETKMSCMMGMLLCLDRTQRLIFILGAVLGASSGVGGEILEISPESFRQQLSRTRKHLANFMNEKCGLMRQGDSCSCARKTRALMKAGYVDPHNLQFHRHHVEKVKALAAKHADRIDDALDLRAQDLFQDHPFLEPPDYVRLVEELLHREEFRGILNFR
jgi:RNA polymerase sigma factor (sigma-70 family)